MCSCDILLYGCGHRRFLRLNLACPAGLCPGHNRCYAGNTQTARTYHVQAPSFCKKCFNREVKRIYQSFFRARGNFFQNDHLVRDFLQGKYGRHLLMEDKDRIHQRLIKNRDAAFELLEVQFYGPTREPPHDNSAFLYERPYRSRENHQDCLRAFRIADNWDSSHDGDDESLSSDGGDLRDSFLADDNTSTQASEDQEYFHTYRRSIRHNDIDRFMERAFAQSSPLPLSHGDIEQEPPIDDLASIAATQASSRNLSHTRLIIRLELSYRPSTEL